MKIQAKKNSIEILLYENVGGFFGLTAKEFVDEVKRAVKSHPGHDIDLRINSDGGEVFDGIAIYNYLKGIKQRVHTHVDSIAASIASVIALAGDEITIAENAWFMIHEAKGGFFGTAEEMHSHADTIKDVQGSIVDTYRKRIDKTENEIISMLKAETWINAADAVDLGFADNIAGKMDVAACLHEKWFNNIPKPLLAKAHRQPPPDLAKANARRAKMLRKFGLGSQGTE